VHRIAVIGTGGLARAACYALAAVGTTPVDVVVIGRAFDRTTELCYIANARAAAAGRPEIAFEPFVGDLALALSDVDGALVCASTQSPWERHASPSAWTDLVRHAGFGLTLPFQAELALAAGRVLPRTSWLINGCFPDGVNPLLAALDVPVLCGIGNIALLAASAQAALGLPDQRRLRMVAHHVHLHAPAEGDEDVLAWYDDEPVAVPGDLLAEQRSAADRSELNHVTGLAAALLVDAVLTGTPVETHLPGPLGLPGGYPVRVRGAEVELRLPAGLSRSDAVAFNQRASVADGVLVDGGRVVFGSAVGELLPDLADGFAVDDLAEVTTELNGLRERLRGETSGMETPV